MSQMCYRGFLATLTGVVALSMARAQPAQIGQWESLIPEQDFGVEAIHLILMHDQKLLALDFGGTIEYDWKKNEKTPFRPFPNPGNASGLFFCGGHCQLGSGSILFASGSVRLPLGVGHEYTFEYRPGMEPQQSPWTRMDDIPQGLETPTSPAPDIDTRWYSSLTILGSGKVLLTGDRNTANEHDYNMDGTIITHREDVPCIFDPNEPSGDADMDGTQQWRRLGEDSPDPDPQHRIFGARKVIHYYPFMFQLSDSTVVMAGGYWFHRLSLDAGDFVDPTIHTATWKLDLTVDGQEDWLDAGAVMPPVSGGLGYPGGSAVMYRPDKILKSGAGEWVRGQDAGYNS